MTAQGFIGPRIRAVREAHRLSRAVAVSLDLVCFLAAASGVSVAVGGMLRLSLWLMASGIALWGMGIVAWELATGRFH